MLPGTCCIPGVSARARYCHMARVVVVYRNGGMLARQRIKSCLGLCPSITCPRASGNLVGNLLRRYVCTMHRLRKVPPVGMACLRTAVELHAACNMQYMQPVSISPCWKHGHGNVTILLLRVAVNIEENLWQFGTAVFLCVLKASDCQLRRD